MFEYLLPVGLNILQEDSNRRAQNAQAAVAQKYQPWNGGGTGGFSNQTGAGNTISAGLGNFMAAQDEKARRQEQQDLISQLLNPGGVSEQLATNDNPATSQNLMGTTSAAPNPFAPNKFKALAGQHSPLMAV